MYCFSSMQALEATMRSSMVISWLYRTVYVAAEMSWGPGGLVGLKVGCCGVTCASSTSFHLSPDGLADTPAWLLLLLPPLLPLPLPRGLLLLAEPLWGVGGLGSSPEELSCCSTLRGRLLAGHNVTGSQAVSESDDCLFCENKAITVIYNSR